jgi:hypothetical protein
MLYCVVLRCSVDYRYALGFKDVPLKYELDGFPV